jgi:Protein of unknown function (DUF3102)
MMIPNRTVDSITSELHVALRRKTADILTVGSLLAEAKGKIPHGQWLPWLKKECSMSERTAQKCVEAADFAAEAKSQVSATGRARQHARRRSGVNQRDELEFRFTAAVLALHRLTKSCYADRFAESLVGEDILARVGQLLTDIASLRAKREALEAGDEWVDFDVAECVDDLGAGDEWVDEDV